MSHLEFFTGNIGNTSKMETTDARKGQYRSLKDNRHGKTGDHKGQPPTTTPRSPLRYHDAALLVHSRDGGWVGVVGGPLRASVVLPASRMLLICMAWPLRVPWL